MSQKTTVDDLLNDVARVGNDFLEWLDSDDPAVRAECEFRGHKWARDVIAALKRIDGRGMLGYEFLYHPRKPCPNMFHDPTNGPGPAIKNQVTHKLGVLIEIQQRLKDENRSDDVIKKMIKFPIDNAELARECGLKDANTMSKAICTALKASPLTLDEHDAGEKDVKWSRNQLKEAEPFLPKGKLKKWLEESGI